MERFSAAAYLFHIITANISNFHREERVQASAAGPSASSREMMAEDRGVGGSGEWGRLSRWRYVTAAAAVVVAVVVAGGRGGLIKLLLLRTGTSAP